MGVLVAQSSLLQLNSFCVVVKCVRLFFFHVYIFFRLLCFVFEFSFWLFSGFLARESSLLSTQNQGTRVQEGKKKRKKGGKESKRNKKKTKNRSLRVWFSRETKRGRKKKENQQGKKNEIPCGVYQAAG